MKYKFEVLEQSLKYQGFFCLQRVRLRHELFAGGWSKDIIREVFERGHAAAALLYDPLRDEVVLIEQFRIGALESPEGPWLLEIVAGIIEPGEEPEDVIRREAVEEAGCEILDLEFIADFNLSPGGCSERMHLYCARVDASNAGGIHGLPEEGEDIRVSVHSADEALALLEAGKASSATPMLALQWFALHRTELREKWSTAQ